MLIKYIHEQDLVRNIMKFAADALASKYYILFVLIIRIDHMYV